MMRHILCLLSFVIVATGAAFAQTPAGSQGVSFLESDTDYIIQFPDQLNAFRRSESSVDFGTTSDGQRIPVTTEINHVVSVFTVRRLTGSQWVLLEHPAKLKDAARWNLKRTSAAKLNAGTIAKLEATEAGKNRLAELRRYAEWEVGTERTWVNLAHAFAISELPAEDEKPEFSVNVRIRKSEPKDP